MVGRVRSVQRPIVIGSVVILTLILVPAAGRAGVPVRPHGACGWVVVPSPSVGRYGGFLTSVSALSGTDAWAVGDVDHRDGATLLAEHWNGSAWRLVKAADTGRRESFFNGVRAVSTADVWAVGEAWDVSGVTTLIEHWDGMGWTLFPSPNPGGSQDELFGVDATSTTDAWAVGLSKDSTSGPPRPLVLHWDGATWSEVKAPSGVGTLLAVTAISPSDAWAVGWHHAPSSDGLALHWNGRRWKTVPTASLPNGAALEAVDAVSRSDVWAVGESTDLGQAVSEHWDGSAWSLVDTVPTASTPHSRGVAAFGSDAVLSVGYVYGPDYGPLTEAWDGSAWASVPAENSDLGTFLYGLSVIPGTGQAWSVGNQQPAGVATQPVVERYC